MSELISKQEVLSEIAFAMVDDIPDVQALYDKIESMEPIQPTFNENQQQVLVWLKTGHCDGDSVFEALEQITYVYEDPKTEEALEPLSPYQEFQVINSFMNWALEQEEER